MNSKTLISCEDAGLQVDNPKWLFVDCRYDIVDKDKGLREYATAHVPGAVFAHIDRDLSGPVGDGRKGRHPLPIAPSFVRWCGSHGITPETQVVVYDDQAGQWASRLWWLLRHYGHANVALLDGGLTRWKSLRLPLKGGHETPRKTVPFKGAPGQMPTIDTPLIETGLGKPGEYQLIDARAGERFRGEVEPLDKKAGHIPGALSLPFGGNVGSEMRFLPADKLLERFEGALGVQEAGRVASYCGSGVTGAHNVLAMEIAGMGTPALYPGSWSEWCFPEADRPVETGDVKKIKA